ncbi:MAG: SRPBCC family protein [Nocardioides sp.]
MPRFSMTTHTDGPVEEVWKLLHDPTRFPEWWDGIERAEVRTVAPGESAYTVWTDGYPESPIDQHLEVERGRVTISCLVSDLMFTWRLSEAGTGTDIEVNVEVPEREAHRVPGQQALIETSLATLSRLAATA